MSHKKCLHVSGIDKMFPDAQINKLQALTTGTSVDLPLKLRNFCLREKK